MPREETRDWLEKVREDLLTVFVLAEAGADTPGAICFHCQQAVEKALKAVVIEQGRNPPRTHDLATLVRQIDQDSPQFPSELRIQTYSLSVYAVDF